MAYQVLNINRPDTAIDSALGVFLPFNGMYGLFTSTYTTIDQAVSNLKNLLLTTKGERVLQPKYGTDLIRLLFEPNTDLIKQNVQEVISNPVNFWLPYINIVEIKTVTAEEDPNLDHNISVSIKFQVTTDVNTESLSTITLKVSNNQIAIVDGN
jgi:phage baseplate assembly protein W